MTPDDLKNLYPNLDTLTREEILAILARTLEELRTVSSNCSEIYSYLTDNRISKPETQPSEVIALMSDRWTYHPDLINAEEQHRESIVHRGKQPAIYVKRIR